jgi:uncharacterized protein (TIGR03083 family)
MTSHQERLGRYVECWRSAADDVVALLRSLDEADWSRPTDLPAWDVKGIACHLAHVESDLSGVKQKRVEVPALAHLTAPTSVFTEMGLIARREMTGPDVVDELEQAVRSRHEHLLADPPTDGKADPPRTPGRIGWDWETLLSNRVIDMWMHEQDVRRAVGRPGGFGTPAADHTVATFAHAFPYTVGKRVAPPAGTTAVLDVTGPQPVYVAVDVNDTGRAVPLSELTTEPTVALRMDTESFVILAGGRRPVADVPVEISGDQALGSKILQALPITP